MQDTKNEFNRVNDRFIEVGVRINEKCDDRRAEQLENKIYQCAEVYRVDNLEKDVKLLVPLKDFNELQTQCESRFKEIH